MPCCVIGALFVLQLMVAVNWFRRVILRKKPHEFDENMWIPPGTKWGDRVKSLFSDRKRKKLIIGFLCIEAVLLLTVWLLGGFEVVVHGIGIMMNSHF